MTTVPKIIVALPAYNEADYITNVIIGASKHADEIIVVDDGSTDDTARLARDAGATVVNHDSNRGYGSAIQGLLSESGTRSFDVLVIIDADTQHDPGEIPLLVAPIVAGYDIAIGSRRRTDVPAFRYVGGKILSMFTHLLSGEKVVDSQSGFRAYSKRAVSVLKPKEKGMAISSEIISEATKNGLRIIEVPISVRYTADSSTHNPIVQGFYTLWRVLVMMMRRRLTGRGR